MNDSESRLYYEQWCKNNRVRKTEASWHIWDAAWTARHETSPLARLDDLSEKKKTWVLSTLDAAIEAAKGL